MKKYFLLIILSVFLYLSCSESSSVTESIVNTDDIFVSKPVLLCDSAVLADYATGEIIYEKDSNLIIPPASMTKLVVNYIVFKEIERGHVSLDDSVPIDSESDFRNQPPRSSLMFLEEGQDVTLRECLKGLAVSSGNDAAVAVAKYISGDVDSFINRMNLEMKNLKLEKTEFADTSGYSEKNRTTAGEFLKFIISYLDSFPGSIADFHSLKSFSYPLENNYGVNSGSVHGTIVQYNHNELVGRVDGVDGLKTGYIDESGFNVSLSAERDGMRLAGVIMGSRADTPKEARKRGILDASVLLEYGFSSFKTVEINPELPEPVKVWKGNKKYIDLDYPDSVKVTVPVRKLDSLMYCFEISEPLTAPLAKGSSAGVLKIYSGDKVFESIQLKVLNDIEKAGFIKAAADEVLIFFKYRLFH